MPVRAGDLLGFVGDTGNAGTGNFHLHFAMSHMQTGDSWWQGQPVNPYPLLAGRSGAP
jgi:murein DD-endopeptidase MepM/ murein hydrolase activator NlpD